MSGWRRECFLFVLIMERYNKFLLGFIPGLFIPILFAWVYLLKFFPSDTLNVIEVVKMLYPTAIFGKLLLLSSMPNLALVFVCYKSDSFKLGAGLLLSAMPYFVGSVFLL